MTPQILSEPVPAALLRTPSAGHEQMGDISSSAGCSVLG